MLTWSKTGEPVLLYAADLREAELTGKPSDWLLWSLWMVDFEEKFRRRNGIAPRNDLTAKQEERLMQEAAQRYAAYIGLLDAPDLSEADLRGADLSRVFAPGADLGRAQLQEVTMNAAQLQGAFLGYAKMQGAKLPLVEMQGADLFGAEMERADLSGAKMQLARLALAKMRGVYLGEAQMQWANLSSTELKNSIFGDVPAHWWIGIEWIHQEDIFVSGANLHNADFSYTMFSGSLLHSSDMRCRNLTERQLDGTIGNGKTILAAESEIWSCWEVEPDSFRETLGAFELNKSFVANPLNAKDAEEAQQIFLEQVLCSDRPRVKTGTHVSEPEPN